MHWITENKDWVFSGAGITLLTILAWIVRKCYLHRANPLLIKALVAITGSFMIGLVAFGSYSGFLTAYRQFSWLHVAGPAFVGVGASGWIAYLVAQRRIGSLSSELTAVKLHDTFRDHVTLALNTNAVAHTFIECMGIAKSWGGKCSALLLDLDGFKRVNELHDTKGGDRCLREVAILLAKTLRGESDKLVRFRHGDEFLILLPETTFENAEFVAKRIVRLIEKTDFPVSDSSFERLTASIGYTEIDAMNDNMDLVTDRLDKALKKAKRTKNTYAH